jgi:hypothetical protein
MNGRAFTCSTVEWRSNRCSAHGWIGHWPDESPTELAEPKKSGKATIQNAIWLSWVELLVEVGSEVVKGK